MQIMGMRRNQTEEIFSDDEEEERAEAEARMVAAADPSSVALTPNEWKQNRWLEAWIRNPRSTTTFIEGEQYIMANVAYPMILSMYDACTSGDLALPGRVGAPSLQDPFPRTSSLVNCNTDPNCPPFIKTANDIMKKELHKRYIEKCPHNNTLICMELDPTISTALIFASHPDRATRAKVSGQQRLQFLIWVYKCYVDSCGCNTAI